MVKPIIMTAKEIKHVEVYLSNHPLTRKMMFEWSVEEQEGVGYKLFIPVSCRTTGDWRFFDTLSKMSSYFYKHSICVTISSDFVIIY